MIKDFDSFLSQMSPELGGCPDPLIRQKLVTAARVFAERTDSLRVKLRVPARENQLKYPLEPEFCADILKVAAAKIGESEIHDPFWTFDECVEEERWILEFHPHCAPLLKSGEIVEATCIMAPKTDSTAVPGWWLDKFNEGIIGYAMQELLSMENKPWTNPRRADIFAGRYQSGMARAKAWARALKGHEKAGGVGA